MAEQPPSAEALHICKYAQPYQARMIDALCEQRVSAETERCAQIAAAQKTEAGLSRHHSPTEEGKACWLRAFDTANTIEREIRCPMSPSPSSRRS